MRVVCVSSIEELSFYREQWDEIAGGVPFRSWAWLTAWWRHYGENSQPWGRRCHLFVLCVVDNSETLLGAAPWYLEISLIRGRVVKFLGSGEVCSEYLTILSRRGVENEVTGLISRWLEQQLETERALSFSGNRNRWDLIDLSGVRECDMAFEHFLTQLKMRGFRPRCYNSFNCWQIRLPATWEGYLAQVSKKGRKRLRSFERNFMATGRAKLHTVLSCENMAEAMEILIHLHKRRRQWLGDPEQFVSKAFAAFCLDVSKQLARERMATIFLLEVDGIVLSALYQLLGKDAAYSYQSGIESKNKKISPGWLLEMAAIRMAIREGYRVVDFLRGDEPHKLRYNVKAIQSHEFEVPATTFRAEIYYAVRTAKRSLKKLIKRVLFVCSIRKYAPQ